MECNELHKFMKDYDLYSDKVPKVAVELMFKKRGKISST